MTLDELFIQYSHDGMSDRLRLRKAMDEHSTDWPIGNDSFLSRRDLYKWDSRLFLNRC